MAPRSTAQDPEDVEVISPRLRRGLLQAVVLGALVFGGLAFYADAGAIARGAASVSIATIVWGTALASSNFVVRFFRWQYYLKLLGIVIPWRASALVFVSGFAMTVTPGKVGEMVKSLLLKEAYDVSVAHSAPIMLAERLTDLSGLLLLAALGLMTVEHGAFVAAALLAAVVLLFLLCAWKSAGRLAIRTITRVKRIAPLQGKLEAAYGSLGAMTTATSFAIGLGLSLAAWALQCVSLNVFASAFPLVTLTIREGMLAYSAPLLAGALALIPGGLGLTEASMTKAIEALGGSGATPSVAASITILSRLSSFWLAVLLGFGALTAWRYVGPHKRRR